MIFPSRKMRCCNATFCAAEPSDFFTISGLTFGGGHNVPGLHPEVSVLVNANVTRSEEEAKIQAKTGKAVVSREEEEKAKDAKEGGEKKDA